MIHELGQNQYLVSGEVSVIDKNTIEITELPVRTWTQVHFSFPSLTLNWLSWPPEEELKYLMMLIKRIITGVVCNCGSSFLRAGL